MRVSILRAAWLALQSLSSCAAVQQIPIHSPDKLPLSSSWNLNYSSEAPHYFSSVYGLLQQWPQTYFPNGFSIVPCEIPPFTKLYHGRYDGDMPPSPEWLAFDIAMSYAIMGSSRNSHMLTYQTVSPVKAIYFDGESATLSGTGQLDTQMLHIWGNLTGPTGNHSRFEFLYSEYARARGLCTWLKEKKLGGLGWGYEAVVRMNAGFELIWCNFTSPSIRLVSHLNVTVPLLPEKQKPPEGTFVESNPTPAFFTPTSLFPLPGTRSIAPTDTPKYPGRHRNPFTFDREPFRTVQQYDWYLSSASHYGTIHSPGLGEYRVKLDTCGFMSYYDPIFESQGLARAQKERESLNLTDTGTWLGPGTNGTRNEGLQLLARRRRLHTLEVVSPSDAAVMRTRSERVLNASLSTTSNCSGIDWFILTNDIVQTSAQPIFKLSKTLDLFESVADNETSLKTWASEIRDQSHSFLLPFYEYPDPTSGSSSSKDQNSAEALSRCRYQHTRMLYPDQGIYLGPSETLLKWSIEETQGTICTVLIKTSLAIESFWQSTYNQTPQSHLTLQTIKTSVHHWKSGTEELMAWLGWVGEYTNCEKKCAWDETCYIPMWPVIPWRFDRPYFNGTFPPYRSPGNGSGYPLPRRPYGFDPWRGSEEDLWNPKCTKKSFFLTGRRP